MRGLEKRCNAQFMNCSFESDLNESVGPIHKTSLNESYSKCMCFTEKKESYMHLEQHNVK